MYRDMNSYEECSCNGNNENCFKCYGTGQVSVSEQTPIKSIKIVSKNHINSQKKEDKKEVYTFQRSILGKFQKEILVKCRICTQLIEKKKIKSHILVCKKSNLNNYSRKFKSDRVVKDNEIISSTQLSKVRTLILCPNCNVQVKVHRFERHMLQSHNKNVNFTYEKTSNNLIVSDSNNYDDIVEKKINDDATKLYAYNFRENGRFGSHPEHDDHN